MWTCKNPACRERIENDFDVCWNCGYDKKGTPPEDAAVFDEMIEERQGLEDHFVHIEAEDTQRQASIDQAIRARPKPSQSPPTMSLPSTTGRRQSGQSGQKWEYLFAEFNFNFGWVLRSLDHKEPPKPIRNLPMADFSAKLGEEGWELVSSLLTPSDAPGAGGSISGLFSRGREDAITVILLTFKRPKG